MRHDQPELLTREDVLSLTAMQDHYTHAWHGQPVVFMADHWGGLVLSNHGYNYQLWHEEDQARRDDKGFEHVYQAKRNIDGYNQLRNDFMEKMDVDLHAYFQLSGHDDLPKHTETPGMIIDRLSILSLKIYHMQLQANRQAASAEHRHQCAAKVAILAVQRDHVVEALVELFRAFVAKERTFILYKQMKMYNDPTLNPQLYQVQQ